MENNFYTVKLLDLILQPNKDESDMGLFIVMENVESDLKTTMEQFDQVGMTRDHVNKIIYNCVCAVKFIHSANVIHRDIKPANILIDSECRIKICDFGLARSLPESCVGQGSGNTKRMRDSIMKSDVTQDIAQYVM